MNSRKLGKIRKYGKKPQGKYSLIDSVLKAGYRLKGGFYDKGRRGQVPVPAFSIRVFRCHSAGVVNGSLKKKSVAHSPALLRIRKPTIAPWNCLTTQ